MVGLNALPYSLLLHAVPPKLPHPLCVPPPPVLEDSPVPVLPSKPLPLAVTVPVIDMAPAISLTDDKASPLTVPATVIAPVALTVHVPSMVSTPVPVTASEVIE